MSSFVHSMIKASSFIWEEVANYKSRKYCFNPRRFIMFGSLLKLGTKAQDTKVPLEKKALLNCFIIIFQCLHVDREGHSQSEICELESNLRSFRKITHQVCVNGEWRTLSMYCARGQRVNTSHINTWTAKESPVPAKFCRILKGEFWSKWLTCMSRS